jgi:hypothetical protein
LRAKTDGQGIAGRTEIMKAEKGGGIFQDPIRRFDLRKNAVM